MDGVQLGDAWLLFRLDSRRRMRLIIAAGVILGLVALTSFFLITARAVRRDLNRRVDEIRVRLEGDANAVVDTLLLDSTDCRS
jgi:hypothetical protein